jgi:hypothetical protein
VVAEEVDMQIPVLLHRETDLFDIGRSMGYRLRAPSNIIFVDHNKEEIYQGIGLDRRKEIGQVGGRLLPWVPDSDYRYFWLIRDGPWWCSLYRFCFMLKYVTQVFRRSSEID